ncbi:MAG TPA: ribosome small subunit-dependent GTPase A [Clostridia bacterium]|nr:ribosome small subunit-dependent GTPase A [Clostridia bacterium]
MSKNRLNGKVIKGITSRYYVDTVQGVKFVLARKKVKNFGEILVGDFVELSEECGTFIIENVLPRRNKLIRPYVANVDICLIVVAPLPKPDFLLVDKIIINCLVEGIKPILVANKSDISEINELSEYKNIVDIYSCSATSGEGIERLLNSLDGKTVCFAGQSAVGKSSIINAVLQTDKLQTSALSKKSQRGKHTTRQTELLRIGNCFLIDTCGFSLLDAVDLEPERLRLYFDEFELLQPLCQFRACTHLNEPNCAVKSEVGISVSLGRYERYKAIYEELVEKRNNKFN